MNMGEGRSYNIRPKITSIIANASRYIVLIACSYMLLYPLLYIILGSIKAPVDFNDPTVVWIPKHFTFDNIKLSVEVMQYGKAFWSSIINGIIPAFLQFCISAFAAYGLARFKFKGRSVLTGLLLLSILVPEIMIIIPKYASFSHMDFLGFFGWIYDITGVDLRLKLIDTSATFILPAILGVGIKGGFFIFIFMQFFRGMPKELEEAAWIDGAGPLKTFLSIIVPSSGSAAITVILFAVVWNWGNNLQSQMFLTDNYPLSVQLESLPQLLLHIIGSDGQAKAVLLSACGLFLIPVIIFYIVLQRKFIESITTTGITGT